LQRAHTTNDVATALELPVIPSTETQESSCAVSLPARPWEALVAAIIVWVFVVALQWQAGAYRAEFASHPDEAAHYVTGLMIHDWITSPGFAAPLAFAKQFYAHYPKVAFGIWPPLFHVIEAVWMLLFTPSKVSLLLLEALIGASLAALLYWALRQRYPFWFLRSVERSSS